MRSGNYVSTLHSTTSTSDYKDHDAAPAERMMTFLTGKRTHERSRRMNGTIKFPVKVRIEISLGIGGGHYPGEAMVFFFASTPVNGIVPFLLFFPFQIYFIL